MTIDAVYNGWHSAENSLQKQAANESLKAALEKRHRVCVRDYNVPKSALEEYDIVIMRKPQYHHSLCDVLKNAPGLPTPELALLADGYDLRFGFREEGNLIRISED